MCQVHKWLISTAAVSGLIQSVVWMGFGIAGALVYLCVIPVAPYKNENDFFRVTFIKLYFEGPQCKPNGSYLGKFNEDYRNNTSLFTPDKVFSIMISYVTLNAVYFVLSISFYMSRKEVEKRKIILGWSGMTLILCAIDAIVTAAAILDVIRLTSYMKGPETVDVYTSSAAGILSEIPYIPLVLALVSSRFIVCWLWNFLVGIIFFLDALCCRKLTGKSPKHNKRVYDKRHKIVEDLRQRIEDRATSVSLISGRYYNAYDATSNPDYLKFRKSMEAVTKFDRVSEKSSSHTENMLENKKLNEAYWYPSKSHSSKEWEAINEGFVNDEQTSFESEKHFDLDRNVKNFKSKQRENIKPPIGKPVSIPVPPPLPINGSCNC